MPPLDAPTVAEYQAFQDAGSVDPGRVLTVVRNGMDRRSGKLLSGWPHVLQSLYMIFETRFHERILREWVGSFVPHLLGKNIVEPTFARFFWAVSTACALWEPCYEIDRILVRDVDGDPLSVAVPTTVDSIREGSVSLVTEGIYFPRGHLGDFTPDERRSAKIVGLGGGKWNVT